MGSSLSIACCLAPEQEEDLDSLLVKSNYCTFEEADDGHLYERFKRRSSSWTRLDSSAGETTSSLYSNSSLVIGSMNPLRKQSQETSTIHFLQNHTKSDLSLLIPNKDTKAELQAKDSTGSQLLREFYNLVLECDHSKFFINERGEKTKGDYLSKVSIVDNYFKTCTEETLAQQAVGGASFSKEKRTTSNATFRRRQIEQPEETEDDFWASIDAIYVKEAETSGYSYRSEMGEEEENFNRTFHLFSPMSEHEEFQPFSDIGRRTFSSPGLVASADSEEEKITQEMTHQHEEAMFDWDLQDLSHNPTGTANTPRVRPHSSSFVDVSQVKSSCQGTNPIYYLGKDDKSQSQVDSYRQFLAAHHQRRMFSSTFSTSKSKGHTTVPLIAS